MSFLLSNTAREGKLNLLFVKVSMLFNGASAAVKYKSSLPVYMIFVFLGSTLESILCHNISFSSIFLFQFRVL